MLEENGGSRNDEEGICFLLRKRQRENENDSVLIGDKVAGSE